MAYSHTYTLFIINFIVLSMLPTSSNADYTDNFLKSMTTIKHTEKTTTHLHFYFHDIHSGKSPTAVQIIRQGLGFGTTFMIDNKLTEGPQPDSKIIGRAQGMYSFASQNDAALLMVVTYVFTEGTYNGSSISVLGRNHVIDDVREMPVVGGSGAFRFARGYALAHTVWFDPKTGDASVEYNVTINHF